MISKYLIVIVLAVPAAPFAQCVFRSKVTTHFGAKLPLISEQSYHLFRSESFHFLCRCRNGW